MAAAAPPQVAEVLQAAGLQLVVTPERALKVTPAHLLTQELREVIKGNRELLINWLGTEAVNHFQNWVSLAQTYRRHHFNCTLCIAAGRGAWYGQRCGVGGALWRIYAKVSSESSFNQTPAGNR